MTNFEYPSWQQPYQGDLLEFDQPKLQIKIEAAENAVFLGLREIAGNPDQAPERAAVGEAVSKLRAIQVERLSYLKVPDEFLNNQ